MNKKNFKDEESELEKEIEEEEEIIEAEEETPEEITPQEFHEFIQQPLIESSAPVLKEIKPIESLEQDIASIPIIREIKEDEKEIKYSSKYNESDYKTMVEEERTDENRILKTPVVFEQKRISLHPQEQEFKFMPEIEELRQSEGDLEKNYVIKTGRIEQEHRLPFERTEKKYD